MRSPAPTHALSACPFGHFSRVLGNECRRFVFRNQRGPFATLDAQEPRSGLTLTVPTWSSRAHGCSSVSSTTLTKCSCFILHPLTQFKSTLSPSSRCRPLCRRPRRFLSHRPPHLLPLRLALLEREHRQLPSNQRFLSRSILDVFCSCPMLRLVPLSKRSDNGSVAGGLDVRWRSRRHRALLGYERGAGCRS